LTRETAVKTLKEFSAALKGPDVSVGVHCCGNTDWSIFTEVETIDIINFDAFGYLDKLTLYGQDIGAFLKRSGILCWGVVPTQDFQDGLAMELLAGKIRSGIDALVKKGASRDLLSEQLLLSPSCGLGTLDVKTSENIFRLLSGLSAYIRKAP
jgi:methionine synthase II (cobalamin-independent)